MQWRVDWGVNALDRLGIRPGKFMFEELSKTEQNRLKGWRRNSRG